MKQACAKVKFNAQGCDKPGLAMIKVVTTLAFLPVTNYATKSTLAVVIVVILNRLLFPKSWISILKNTVPMCYLINQLCCHQKSDWPNR